MTESILTRRGFLRSTAAASLGASLGLSRLRGDPAASPGISLRWGVIGCGKRALRAHFPSIKSMLGMEILAVCDVMESHLRQGIAAAGGKAAGYDDYRRLLAHPGIEAVVIATPGLLHCEMVIAALQAGKHVVCEKPMGLDIEQGNAMKRAAEASDRTVLYTTQLQYSPYYAEVRRQIEAGRIGQPRHMIYRLYRGDWASNGWLYTDPKTGRKINWRMSQAASGGPLTEEGCHYFELLHWMAGALPRRVQCDGNIAVYRDGRDTWDHTVTTMEYEGGCLATLDLCLFGRDSLDLQVIGESGSLHALVDSHALLFEPRDARTKPTEIPVPPEIGHGIRGPNHGIESAELLMYGDFVAAVRQGRQLPAASDKVLAACKTAWLGELSAQRRREVAWNELS